MLLLLAGLAQAGLGPDDVIVLYNADDPEALATAQHYADARDIPSEQLCAITGVDPAAREVAFADFDSQIRTPFEACRDALPYPDDIDAIVIVRGLPYRVKLPQFYASLEATLQVGRAVDGNGVEVAGQGQVKSGTYTAASVFNPAFVAGGQYAADTTYSYGPNGNYMTAPRIVRGENVPGPFRRTDRHANARDFTGELYVVSRLDGFDHDDARALVDRSLLSDAGASDDPLMCMHGADSARGVRDGECRFALLKLDEAGINTTWLDAFDDALSGHTVMAYWTGAANLKGSIDGVTYAPGAVTANLTSFGAAPSNFFCNEGGEACPASESQTSIARFVRAGASAAHGTVAEPLNNTFPNAGMLILYGRGYTLGEAALYNQQYLYWQNLWLGDPLMAPYAERPEITIPAEHPADQPLPTLATHPDGVAWLTIYADGDKVWDDAPPAEGTLPVGLLGLAEGDTVELTIIATAAPPAPDTWDGWPATVQLDPGTKGWRSETFTVIPGAVEETGCGGCSSAGGHAGWMLGLLVLPWVGRRRSP